MQTRKTYKNRTALTWLNGCEVSEMQSGDFEITHPFLAEVVLTFHPHEFGGNLSFSCPAGPITVLEMSEKAIKKALELEEELEKKRSQISIWGPIHFKKRPEK
jgi:hypothetical protein